MGVRVNAESLRRQLTLTNQLHFLEMPYHRAILNGEIPLSIGGGIGQSRTLMLLLQKAHLGEVSVNCLLYTSDAADDRSRVALGC